ncbi:MAG: hypothetical protein HYV04_12445 [Deltaproteobacteria bacterium]|nr:hypothetical protein [Deltaproteobacteria bacterium]
MTYVVGSAAGDSTDLWARAVTRNMAKHIPGKPHIVVQNMPGASGLIAANYIYGGAKLDGLTMGSVSAGHYFHQLFGHKKSRFDWRKFTWIGSSSRREYLLVVRADTPYKSIEDIRAAKEPPKCSAAGAGSASHLTLKILEESFGLKLKIDTDYGEGSEQDLALERGEVQCRGIAAASFGREPVRGWMKKKLIRVLVQTSPKRNLRLPEVPTVYELMDRFHVPAANRRVALVMLGVDNFGDFPTVASPGVPTNRTKILRAAYAKALEDPDLLDEARKRGWNVDPISGEDLESLAREVLGQPAGSSSPEVTLR